MPLTERVLPNGIRLITEPIATTKAVAIGFWFRMGSRDERSGEAGITHFAEHLLFKGTASRSASDISRFFDRAGGYANAFTEREITCLHCLVPAHYAVEALSVLADMAWSSTPTDGDIELERSVIESEILGALDDPEDTGSDVAMSLMYPGHPLARPIAGTLEDVSGIAGKDVRTFLSDRLGSVAPIITVAGDFDADRLESVLRERTTRSAFNEPVADGAPPLWSPGRHAPISRFGQSQIFLAYPVANASTPEDWYAWSMINALTGGSVSSRLFQSLRENSGLCYSVYSACTIGRDAAFWGAYAATPKETTTKAVRLLISEIEAVAREGFSDREIEDSRTHVIGEILLSAEDTENRMKRIARQFLFGKKVYTVDECVSTIGTIDANTVRALIRDAFVPSAASLVVYSDKKRAKECVKIWR
jgi:predicted Zn-dependent peptidase